MAVGVVQEFVGGTLEQYDQVISKMGFTPGGQGAPGDLFHWVTKTDDGIRITDVWETREQFEAFAHDQVGRLATAVGVTGTPQVTFFEVHCYLTIPVPTAIEHEIIRRRLDDGRYQLLRLLDGPTLSASGWDDMWADLP